MKKDWFLHLFCIGLSVLISYWLGEVAGHFIMVDDLALKMLVVVGSGWALHTGLVLLGMPGKRSDYFRNLSMTMLIGVLCLVPGNALSFFFGYPSPWIPVLSVVLSFGVMFYRHFRMIQLLHRSQIWTLSWLLSLLLTATCWMIYFLTN